MCKVCLTDSNTVFSADAVFWQNHWIWRVRFLVYRLIKLAEHVLLNSPYNPLTIELAGFSAKSWTRKYKPDFWLNLEQGNWGWRVASTRILIFIKNASSLGLSLLPVNYIPIHFSIYPLLSSKQTQYLPSFYITIARLIQTL